MGVKEKPLELSRAPGVSRNRGYFAAIACRGRRKRLNDFVVVLSSSKKSVKSSNELVLVLKI